jgi:hypothetical protein
MLASSVIRIAGFIVLGAILANVLRNPRGTAALAHGVDDLWRHGLQAAGGQKVGGR